MIPLLAGFLAVAASAGASSPAPFKKIEITATNNEFPSFRSDLYPADAVSSATLADLRAYVLKRVDLKAEDDPGVIVQALGWVGAQWDHDGMNEPRPGASALEILTDVHEKGARYRCVEYGVVLADLLKSLGYVTRKVSLKSVDAPYGGFGQGHVATEVWSNRLRKWIFVDPQFGVYPTRQGLSLNFDEMFELKKAGKWSEIEFNVTENVRKAPGFNAKAYDRDYREFLSHYFGYVHADVQRGGKTYRLVLPLEGKAQFLTFQGWAIQDVAFASRVSDLYFDVNRAFIGLHYRDGDEGSKATLDKYQVKTEEDFLAKRGLFAAKPDFVVSLTNNSVWHAHYEYRLSDAGPWTRLDGDSMPWSLVPGDNELQVRSVNRMGLAGPATFVKIAYR